MPSPNVTINGTQVPLAEFAQSINAEVRYGNILVCSVKTLKFPFGVASVGGSLYLRGYDHPLPAALASVGGYLYLDGYVHPLPAALASVGGSIYLGGYVHPLPAALASVGGYLDLDGYVHPLPAALTSVGGSIYLGGYVHPLPAALASVGGDLDLGGYVHPLPNWIISAGADSRGYWFSAVKQNGAWRIRAGCRNFSVAAALAHWGSGGQSDNPECLALVKKIVAEIDVRDAVVAEVV